MCGIVAIQGTAPVAEELVLALAAVQHRGQDAAGVLTFDGRFRLHKGEGLATQVFAKPDDVARLTGSIGLGHVRYATQGSLDWLDAQPFATSYPFGIGMVHNGNVVNFAQIRARIEAEGERLLETANDVELLVHVLVKQLERQGGSIKFSPQAVFEAVTELTEQVDGAYSALALVAQRGLVAFRDRHGIRPLLWGQKRTADGVVNLFASESTVFDVLGFSTYRDLLPGEVVFVEPDGTAHTHRISPKRPAFCTFEYIYFAREDSTLEGRTVASERVGMGKLLAAAVRARGLDPDVVIDVPSSA
ncbi:MAG: amidophosphoribosyltransferase, partial [Proteobacteria bacterium]